MASPNSPPIIRAHDVDLAFQEQVGVFDLNFAIPPGTIFGLIGPSGCGKTTTVRLLTGIYQPSQGTLQVMGQSPGQFTPRMRERIGYMPQHFVLYPNLTVRENMSFVASLYGVSYFKRQRRFRGLLDFVQLTEARHRLGSQLSGGMQRRLLLACALIHDPLLIFADEPTAGIDPVLRSKFWDYFRQLRDQGRTLFITTQYVGEAAYCDLVGVMREGRMIHIDTPEGLRRRALGGEVIKLVVTPERVLEAAQILSRHPAVNDIRRSRSQIGLLYLYVDDAGETLPLLFNLLRDYPEIEIRLAEEYQPPFDDIFIRLMEQSETSYA